MNQIVNVFLQAVLLLLSSSCVSGIEDKKQYVIHDQMTLASKREAEKIRHAVADDVISNNVSSTVAIRSAERVPIHYQNSNGFVPIILSDGRNEDQQVRNYSMSSGKLSNDSEIKKSESLFENDPVYSTEARIFLNLPRSGANRRSYDSGDRRSDFELLKVDNDTPKVANYQEFYDNVQSVMNKSRDPADVNKKKSQKSRSKEEAKRIQSHMDTYDTDSIRNNGNSYNHHYPLNSYSNNQFKSDYDPEKVNSNHYEQDISGYNLQRNVASKEKLTLPRTNYNEMQSSVSEKKSLKNEGISKSMNTIKSNRNMKPFKNVEPTDYKIDMKFEIQSVRSTATPSLLQANLYNSSDSSNSQSANVYVQDSNFEMQGTSRHYDRSEDSQGFSDESLDYTEITEKPRRLHKSRRRPINSELSRKLPKEHRGSGYSQGNDDRTRHNLSKSRQRHRQRNKYHSWDEEGRYQFEDENNQNKQFENSGSESINANSQTINTESSDAWNQVTPNLEVSHSNGYEVDQIEKPKLLFPVNVNLVPLTHFDHKTALGNSQGFDVTNAMIQNFGAGLSIISTAAPFGNTPPHNLGQKNEQNIQNSEQASDIIVGQNTFQNPVSVFLPHGQNLQTGRTQYIQSTVTPLFTVTQSGNPNPHNTVPSTVTSRPLYGSASTVIPNFQQILLPQPTLQTLTNMLQGNANANVQIHSHGLQGQNVLQFQNIPSVSTTSNPVTQRHSSYGGDGHYLATASLTVENEAQKANNDQQKTFYQTVPGIVPVNLAALNFNNQNQQVQQNSQNSFFVTRPRDNDQILKATNDAFLNSMKDLQMQIQRNQLSNSGYQAVDNIRSSSNNNANTVNAIAGIPVNIFKSQLPAVGTKNVEIVNPNMKPSPVDFTIFNPVTPINSLNQYTAMYTTPIPVLSTTSFVTSRPLPVSANAGTVHLNNYVDTLTEFGTKPPSTHVYNPINFVPNDDLVKSQSVLNSKLPQNEILPQNLNLVPLLPGGNFFKNSHGAQANLAHKPKLHSDLENYAEEMLKESLKTMYSSHKWNNDHRIPENISIADTSEFAKLRNELLRLKTSSLDTKMPKDILEAHPTENKVRTLSSRPADSDTNKPYFSMEQIEQILKDNSNLHASEFETGGNRFRINDYLTPPKQHSFISKSPFHEKSVKKRPGPGPSRFSRPHSKKGAFSSKTPGLEASASNNFDFSFDSSQFRKNPYFERDIVDFRPGRHGNHHGRYRKKNSASDSYSTFTASLPDFEQRISSKEFYDVNTPRFHNLLGLLMKNKRLPPGSPQSTSNNKDKFAQILEAEKQRSEYQFYNDALQGFQKKSGQPTSGQRRNASRNFSNLSLKS